MTRFSFAIIAGVLALTAAPRDTYAQVQLPRFLPDVVAQFNALTTRPDPMGFHIGDGPDPSMCRHNQALLRVDAPDGTPYIYMTRSGPPRDFCPEEEIPPAEGDPIANLYIARMGSRDTNGERLRSNRLEHAARTTNTPPDPRDIVVRSILYNGTFDGDSNFWPPYDHPAGMQQVGNIAAIGVTFPRRTWVPSPIPHWEDDPTWGNIPILVQFVDVTDPENPRIRTTFKPDDHEDHAGVVALTPCGANRGTNVPCASGHYLLAISGEDNSMVHFYESSTNDLYSTQLSWTHLYKWHKDELIPSDVCTPRPFVECWHAHQTLNFLREGDLGGALYVAGARGPGRSDPDFIDLYRVELATSFAEPIVRITQVATKHLISHPAWEGEDAGARIASLAAASTFHITPGGELLFYAAEHDNDGPEGANHRGSVKMGEWRHIEIARPDSPTLLPNVQTGGPYVVDEGSSVILTGVGQPPITKAWLELFEHPDHQGRYLVMEYDDRNKDDFNDFTRLDPNLPVTFDTNGASNEASSVLWFAPPGCTIRANDDAFEDPTQPPTGDTLTLPGDGIVLGYHDFSQVRNDDNTGDVDNIFTSVQFLGDCDTHYGAPIALAWDLNNDGQHETPGSQASFFAEEGPAVVQVPVQAVQGSAEGTGLARASVTINNVAPSIDSAIALDPAGHAIGIEVPFVLEHRPVSFHASFSDPGRLDRQTALLNWADGTVDSTFAEFSDAFGGVEGRLRQRHVFSAAGTYEIALEITDDDSAFNRSVTPIAVVSPAGATASIIERLDSLIASTTDATVRRLLQEARKALAGRVTGIGNDGALYKLQNQQTAAAVAHLTNALSDLRRAQEAGADVTVLIGLVEEVIAAATAG